MDEVGIFPLEVKVIRGSGIVQNKEYLTARVGKIRSPVTTCQLGMGEGFCERSETRCSGSRDGQVSQELPLSKEKYKRQKPHVARIRKGRIKRSVYVEERKKVVNTFCSCTAPSLAENGTDLRRIAESVNSARTRCALLQNPSEPLFMLHHPKCVSGALGEVVG